jgi:hypothetical protein
MPNLLLLFFLLAVTAISGAAQKNQPLVAANGKTVEIDEGWTYLAHKEQPKGKVWILYLYRPEVFQKMEDGTLTTYIRRKPYMDDVTDILYVLDRTEVRCKSREWRVPLQSIFFANGTILRTVDNDTTIFRTPVNSLESKMLRTVCKLSR